MNPVKILTGLQHSECLKIYVIINSNWRNSDTKHYDVTSGVRVNKWNKNTVYQKNAFIDLCLECGNNSTEISQFNLKDVKQAAGSYFI